MSYDDTKPLPAYVPPAKKRGKLRPVSQTGLHRIPHNPHQRVARDGGAKTAGIVLDAFNDKAETRTLHPTNGWRKLSVKRSRAQMLVGSILNGASADLKAMRRFIATGI